MKTVQRNDEGFTLIEMMIVVAIISIMATMALPNYQDRIIRTQVKESFAITEPFKESVVQYYKTHHKFPTDNKEAGIPSPEHLIGNFVTQVTLINGAMHVELGNKVNAHVDGRTITIRPAIVTGSPESPLSWLCGNSESVPGMEAIGDNYTSLATQYLPMECRAWRD